MRILRVCKSVILVILKNKFLKFQIKVFFSVDSFLNFGALRSIFFILWRKSGSSIFNMQLLLEKFAFFKVFYWKISNLSTLIKLNRIFITRMPEICCFQVSHVLEIGRGWVQVFWL